MKIAMLGHKRIPGREGGVEVVVEELSTGLVKLGNSVTAYNRKKRGTQKFKEYKGVKIVTVPTIEKKSLDAVVYSFLASIRVLFGKYDVIHYHAIGPSFMLIIPHFFRKKTVVTVHGLNYKTPKWKGFGEKYMHWGEVITAKYADRIITLSKEQQKYFKEKYNRDTEYIPNGTELKDKVEPNIIEKKWGLGKDKYILFLSRVVPGKGLENLIEAYKHVDSDLQLIIAGGSEYVSDFRDKVMDMASDDSRIRFIGFVEGQELVELYSNAYLFVFPSEAEGMPMCLLEALSYDTPCLVSDIPENLEVGGEYVQSFKVKNTEDLMERLNDCINNNSLLFTRDTRGYIESKYNWDNIVKRTMKVYENIR